MSHYKNFIERKEKAYFTPSLRFSNTRARSPQEKQRPSLPRAPASADRPLERHHFQARIITPIYNRATIHVPRHALSSKDTPKPLNSPASKHVPSYSYLYGSSQPTAVTSCCDEIVVQERLYSWKGDCGFCS